MKKKLLFLLVIALVFSCCALTVTASASTNIEQGTSASDRNYFSTDNHSLVLGYDFEGGAQPNTVDKFYSTLSIESENPISGSYSLKSAGCDPGYAWNAWYFVTGHTTLTDRYYVQFDVRLDGSNIKELVVSASSGYTTNSDKLLMEAGILANYTEDKLSGYTADTSNVGWSLEDHWDTDSFKATSLGNDVWRLYFEFTLPETELTEQINIQFKHHGDDTNVVVVYDNIKFGTIITPKYFTVDWDVDYNDYNNYTKEDYDYLWSSQPVFVNLGITGELVSNWLDRQCIAISVPANGGRVGGLDNENEGKKLVKQAGLTYFQYDIYVTGCSKVALFTSDIWTEINYDGVSNSWSTTGTPGFVSGFVPKLLDNGGYRLSYFMDIPEANVNMPFIFNTESADGGTIYIDNLVIAHEDYTAYLGNGTYDFANTKDVALDFDEKGKTVESVKLDDVALEATDYTIADGKLTINANKLATTELGKQYTVSVVTSASETPVSSVIAQNDNRAEVTVKYDGEALSKVYDGTTTAPELTLTLEGVANGHTVTYTCDVVLESANAGNTVAKVTNIVLAGADASEYKLANTTLNVDVTVTPVQLYIEGTTVADKTYDGTVNATATAGSLQGIVGDDDVTVSVASAVFDSKDVADASKVLVAYELGGAAKDNYVVPANSEIDKTIAKATVTVTADAKSKTEGDADPELTYTVSGLVEGDKLSGALTRAEGEAVGEYDITIGTLANANYEITFTGAKLTINAKGSETPVTPVDPVTPSEPNEPADTDNSSSGVIIAVLIVVVVIAGVVLLVVIKKKLG